jgi:hypothetical protein
MDRNLDFGRAVRGSVEACSKKDRQYQQVFHDDEEKLEKEIILLAHAPLSDIHSTSHTRFRKQSRGVGVEFTLIILESKLWNTNPEKEEVSSIYAIFIVQKAIKVLECE